MAYGFVDLIRGVAREEPTNEEDHYLHIKDARCQKRLQNYDHRVVVISENGFVVVGVEAYDRPGLLLDISKGLVRLNLNLRHSEASVIGNRSISIWRSEVVKATDLPDLEEIWTVVDALLDFGEDYCQIVKRRGLRVIRAVVAPMSTLIKRTISDVNWEKYKAAIVAVQRGGENVTLNGFVFEQGDILVLKTDEDSPLLNLPPEGFYKSKPSDTNSFLGKVKKNFNQLKMSNSKNNLTADSDPEIIETTNSTIEANRVTSTENNANPHIVEIRGSDTSGVNVSESNYSSMMINEAGTDLEINMNSAIANEEVWKDLQAIFLNKERVFDHEGGHREFLMAMEISGKNLQEKTVSNVGLDKLPGVFLVSIDRPIDLNQNPVTTRTLLRGSSDMPSISSMEPVFQTISPDVPLRRGDVLWFAGDALSVGFVQMHHSI